MTQRFCTAAAGLPRSCAAPAGGAPSGGWGRLGASLVLGLGTCLGTGPVSAETLTLPSGRTAVALEYIADADGQGDVLRARYHARALNGLEDGDAVFADLTHLCETDALAVHGGMTPMPPRIIVSMSSQPLAFGEIDPGVVQYFEAFRIEGTRCVWELF